ncbi:MAG: PQQ-dependent sugar dehydrogenase [Rhodothermaceae bacterium]|nr:PQQ-dependent sugar dehydrogenase [Rhodothermaceae bacterium]
MHYRFVLNTFTLLFSAMMLVSSCSSELNSEVTVAFPNLRFTKPVDLQHAPGSPDMLFVVEQAGVIKLFANNSETSTATAFLDIRDRVRDNANEEGLLGLAFHPGYAENGYFYVNYTASSPRRTVIARYSTNPDDQNQALVDSEQILLEVEQPYGNHNAGQIAFGPDGYLYIAMGDGGSAGDPFRHGQNSNTLLGTMLRIDVDSASEGKEYAIPPDNPFIGEDGFQPEIYAYGLRNPWRFSFDLPSGTLWTGDVGQSDREEINIITKGGNYGWNIKEGTRCFTDSTCSDDNFIAPVLEYGRSKGGSVTGGYVYRGSRIPEFAGMYIYADFLTGRIWAMTAEGNTLTENIEIADTNLSISSFGVDSNNELYICAFDGLIYQLVRPE